MQYFDSSVRFCKEKKEESGLSGRFSRKQISQTGGINPQIEVSGGLKNSRKMGPENGGSVLQNRTTLSPLGPPKKKGKVRKAGEIHFLRVSLQTLLRMGFAWGKEGGLRPRQKIKRRRAATFQPKSCSSILRNRRREGKARTMGRGTAAGKHDTGERKKIEVED